MSIIVRTRGCQIKFKTLCPFFPSLRQITFIIDIKICNLSNTYPCCHCSVACLLISIQKRKKPRPKYIQGSCTKFKYKFHIYKAHPKSTAYTNGWVSKNASNEDYISCSFKQGVGLIMWSIYRSLKLRNSILTVIL